MASSTTTQGASAPKKLVPRLLAVLECLRAAPEPLNGSDVARRTGMPVQTTHRLLSELASGGLTMQDERDRRWSLGPAAIGLGAAAARHISIVSLARPFLEHLAEATRETATLTLPDGCFGTYVDIVESPQPIRLVETVGTRLPLTVGASRWVILAYLPEHERTALLVELHVLGHLENLDKAARECEVITERGHAISHEAVTPHSTGVAVPILSGGRPIASISVGGPAHRISDSSIEVFANELRAASSRLSALLAAAA